MKCVPRRAADLVPLVLLAALAAPPSSAVTREVDDDGTTPYQTIQSAIQAAVPGEDDVFVHCGTYPENIVMRDGVSVRGAGPGCVTIDGTQNGSVVTMVDIGPATVLEGLTIQNGLSGLGGGIFIENGSPQITRNLIIGNHAADQGGLTGYGGGIHITTPVTLRATTAPSITRNVIVDNLADKFGGGIEVYADVSPTIDTNLIKGNVALGGGGGIDVFANSLPTILNNTIVRNCVQDTVATCLNGGGGLTITNSAATIVNNVIAWNESGGGFAGVDVVNSAVTLESNDTFANQPRNYSGVPDPTGTLGNISTDPGFLDENPTMFGHQPASDSPLVDGGATVGLATDLKGIPRPLDGDVDGTALADIGARENEGVSRLRFDTPTSLLWDGGVGPTTFNLYRGDLQILIDTGIYTQDPLAVAGARQFCDLVAPTAVDSDEPDPNQVFFYLAVLESGGIEGTLGFDSVPVERPFTDPNRCP